MGTSVLEDRAAARDEAGVALAEPASGLERLSDAALADEIAVWAGRVAAGEARLLELVGEFDAREAWAGPGMLSCAHWLSWRLGLGPTAARERVRVARALRELPVVAAAFRAGRLSWTQVRALTRVASADDQQRWVDLARAASGSQIERLVRGIRRARLLGEDEEHRPSRTRVSVTYDEDGHLVMSVRLPAEEGAVVVAAVEQWQRELDGQRQEERPVTAASPADAGRPRATLAEGLVAVARAALVQLHATRPASARRTRAALTVQVDPLSGWARLRDGELLPPGTHGTALPQPVTVLQQTTPAHLRRHDLGRSRRLPTAPLRALLGAVDGERCRFPGCSRGRGLDAHHVQTWAAGGRTDLANLVLLCERHHTVVHEQGFRLRLLPDRRLRVSTSAGTPVTALPPLPRRTAGELDPDGLVTAADLPPAPLDARLDLRYAVGVLVQQAA